MAKNEILQKNMPEGDLSKGQRIPAMPKIVNEGQVIPKMTTIRQPSPAQPQSSDGKKQGK